MPNAPAVVPDVIKPGKKLGELKVWHVLLAAAILALLFVLVNNFLIISNVVTSSTGEQYIHKSFLKPLKKVWDPLESTCRHASLSIL